MYAHTKERIQNERAEERLVHNTFSSNCGFFPQLRQVMKRVGNNKAITAVGNITSSVYLARIFFSFCVRCHQWITSRWDFFPTY